MFCISFILSHYLHVHVQQNNFFGNFAIKRSEILPSKSETIISGIISSSNNAVVAPSAAIKI